MSTSETNRTTPRITVLGSLNIDLVSYVPHHPLPGETLTASSFAVSPGGKGANQAVACAKLSANRKTGISSAKVYMVGSVGDDSYGTLLCDNLSRHGVVVEGGVSVKQGLKTGIAIIIVDEPTGQNRIILSPEANHSLQPGDFTVERFGASLGAGSKPDLLILQLEIPLDTVLRVIKTARETGTNVLLNPAPAVKLPDWVYDGLQHLVVNETEAAILSGVEESVLDSEDGLEKISSGFVAKGVRNVIITLGGRGVYYINSQGAKGMVRAEKAKVIDTTAAGDTFVGQYAVHAVQKGIADFDIAEAVKTANRAGAKAVERLGAQDSIPYADELE